MRLSETPVLRAERRTEGLNFRPAYKKGNRQPEMVSALQSLELGGIKLSNDR